MVFMVFLLAPSICSCCNRGVVGKKWVEKVKVSVCWTVEEEASGERRKSVVGSWDGVAVWRWMDAGWDGVSSAA
jgi:hypothetical protein